MAVGTGLLEALAAEFPELVSEDEAMILSEPHLESMLAVVERFAAPDVECAMLGSEGIPEVSYTGANGFRKAWADWLGGFERVRFQFEGVIGSESGFVMLAKQIGTTRYGVELEQPSAMVCKFAETGELKRVEFHLDRDLALRSAGLDPQSSQP
jgi:hypothetical protein